MLPSPTKFVKEPSNEERNSCWSTSDGNAGVILKIIAVSMDTEFVNTMYNDA